MLRLPPVRTSLFRPPRPIPAAPPASALDTLASRKIYLRFHSAGVAANTDGTGSVSNGGQIACAIGQAGTPNFTQSTGGNRPTWNSTNKSAEGFATGIRLEAASPINATGAFTLWAVHWHETTPVNSVSALLAAATGSGNNSMVLIYSDGNLYVSVGSTQRQVTSPGPDGLRLYRVRRTTGNQLHVAATSSADASFGSTVSGTFQAQAVIGRPVSGDYSSSGNDLRLLYFADEDCVTAGTAAGIESEILALFPGLGAIP